MNPAPAPNTGASPESETKLYSEDFQVEVYRRQLSMLSDQETVRGMSLGAKGLPRAAFEVLQTHYLGLAAAH